VGGDWLADDEAILDELADGLAGVGVGDFALLAGVEPDLALAAADDCWRCLLAACHLISGHISHVCDGAVRAGDSDCEACVRVGTDLRRRGASGCED
jgi:hypothetical protein